MTSSSWTSRGLRETPRRGDVSSDPEEGALDPEEGSTRTPKRGEPGSRRGIITKPRRGVSPDPEEGSSPNPEEG